jgi:predicted kinase
MRILYLLQGIPGSGKSFMCELLVQSFMSNGSPPYTKVSIRSTDDQWYDEKGRYNYVSEKLADMHRKNQRLVVEDMQANTPVIIVDNTNIQKWQAEPYLALAKIFDYEIQVIRVEVPVELAIARQADRPEDRRVPADVIREMHSRMEKLV